MVAPKKLTVITVRERSMHLGQRVLYRSVIHIQYQDNTERVVEVPVDVSSQGEEWESYTCHEHIVQGVLRGDYTKE